MPRVAFLLACLLTLPVPFAGAQGAPTAAGEKPDASSKPDRFSLNVIGGLTLPLPGNASSIGAGWNVGVGGTVSLTRLLALRADYLYDHFGIEDSLEPVTRSGVAFDTRVTAKMQMHTGNFDLVLQRRMPDGLSSVYLMGGPSVFHRRVQLRGAAEGQTIFCEPGWLQCASDVVIFGDTMGIRTANDLGFNAGVGVAFRAGLSAEIVIEARYFHVPGGKFTDAYGKGRRSSGHFLPVSVGLRF